MSVIPPAYTQYPQFDELCSCGRRIAVTQRAFEEREQQLLAEGYSLKETRKKILKEFGITMICCLRDYTNFPKHFICDVGNSAFTNITSEMTSNNFTNNKMGNRLDFVGEEFLPLTRNKWGFDPNSYCLSLHRMTLSDVEKIGTVKVITSGTESQPAQFCNFSTGNHGNIQSFPLVFRSTIEPPNNFR